MKYLAIILFSFCMKAFGQINPVMLSEAKFRTGDDDSWKEPGFNDSQWAKIKTSLQWEFQGYDQYDGIGWYRFHFKLPSSLKEKSFLKDSVRIMLFKIDDADETWLNGYSMGKTSGYNVDRDYRLAVDNPALKWDEENVLAIRVNDTGGGGGQYGNIPFISMIDPTDQLYLQVKNQGNRSYVEVKNRSHQTIQGSLHIVCKKARETFPVINVKQEISIQSGKTYRSAPIKISNQRQSITIRYIDSKTKSIKERNEILPYILTPQPSPLPKVNTPGVIGARAMSPIIIKIAATGETPLKYATKGLPMGLILNSKTGLISGTVKKQGTYPITIVVSNARGKTSKEIALKIGKYIALTPPMGWNSWNCWGTMVDEKKVQSAAQAMIKSGLVDYGWNYINIDDGWQNPHRDETGNIMGNDKFPDMKKLGDWLHQNGLKFGIYSSPGKTTCGGHLGSHGHEAQDAQTFFKWGVDYLKYDWCSYSDEVKGDTTTFAVQYPFKKMGEELSKLPRDIVFSLCQYGMKDVWKWGDAVHGNCWRISGDIDDSWLSMSGIGFSQNDQHRYAKPGSWNDPDMLVLGSLGWGKEMHPTKLTPDEQYTHMSLWCLLSAPLLLGCDVEHMDAFTFSLLSNQEVLAVNQDVLAKQAVPVLKKSEYQVWMKPLSDKSYAIGIFNTSETDRKIEISFEKILPQTSIKSFQVRNLWTQKNTGRTTDNFSEWIPSHGVAFIKVTPK